MIRRLPSSWLMIAAVLAASCAFGQTEFKFKELARTGNVAPVPAEISFLSTFAANNNGTTAFIADRGLFVSSALSSNLVVGLGDRAPAGGEFLSADTPSINSKGEIVFRGVVTAPGVSGLFQVSGGRVRELVRGGSVATNGDVVSPILPVIDDSSRVTFINSSIARSGIFRLANGVISKVLARGDVAPGGGTFIRFTAVAANNAGDVAFMATYFPSPGSFVPRTGLFVTSGGTVNKILAVGDVFPEGGQFFAFVGAFSMNDAGQVAFTGISDGVAGHSGVFLYSGGQLQVVVPEFSSLPNGQTLVATFSASINNAGQIAFMSQTLEQNRLGVFLFSQGAVSQIMAIGQATPDGDSFTGAFRVQITSSGQVAFISRLLQHASTLFISSGGEFTRIAGQGDVVDRTPRFVSPFAFGAGTDRVLVFASTFPGGTGLFSAPLRGHEATLVARVGENVGPDGVILGFFENFSMNRQGQVVFNSDLSGMISSIFLKSGDSLNQIVRASFLGTGDTAPDGARS
ncbi:MAG: hypothetical protein L0Z53_25085 [Acidobacteriales bacterium]|nr:hypothetical protein [Terriglobales bacterium]